jgi:hypothetical protein
MQVAQTWLVSARSAMDVFMRIANVIHVNMAKIAWNNVSFVGEEWFHWARLCSSQMILKAIYAG